jgi:hypothetical protein
LLSDGDEIGIRGTDKTLIGSGVARGHRVIIVVWGDDSLSHQGKLGAAEGENLAMTIWNKTSGSEKLVASKHVMDGLTGESVANELIYRKDAVWLVKLAEVAPIPTVFGLEQNYPNPFNPSTTIRYQLPSASFVSMTIFNVLGQVTTLLVHEKQEAGYHQIQWNANVPSGIYFYRLNAHQIDGGQAGEFVETKKMIVLR